jgi:hypothetical protein
MPFPLQIAFEGMAQADDLEDCIRAEAGKLGEFASHITLARVVLGRSERRYHTVNARRVHIHLVRAGAVDIVITRDPAVTGADEDVCTTIRDAFKAVRRRLMELGGQPPGA